MTHPTPPTNRTPSRPVAHLLGDRALNPDTGNRLPSPSAAQQRLVDEALDRLLGEPYLASLLAMSNPSADLTAAEVATVALREALTEAVVREHGRTLRSCIAELRDQADDLDRTAREYAESALTEPAPNPSQLNVAASYGMRASGLRLATLRGDR